MATQEISSYVTGLSSATLAGTEEVYLASDEKTTVQDIADLGNSNVKVWSAQISQTGTSAPVLTTLIDDFGLTLTPARASVGAYYIDGFASNLTGLIKIVANFSFNDYLTNDHHYTIAASSSSRLNFATLVNTVYTDGKLGGGYNYTITVTKYD